MSEKEQPKVCPTCGGNKIVPSANHGRRQGYKACPDCIGKKSEGPYPGLMPLKPRF